jgi:alpha-tubulin suppressor-like RCC1 family protein
MRRLMVLLVMATMLVLVPGAPGAADGNDADGAPPEFRSLTAGDRHTCALRYDGAVQCWGWNFAGQLGLGDTASRGDGPAEMRGALPTVALGTGRAATAIAAGSLQTCALLDNGTVKCWGDNANGQLGIGNTGDRGDQANEMGDALPAVALGTGRTATAITSGDAFSCALLDNGAVKCWGAGAKLGQGGTADRGDGPGEMGDALPAVALGAGRTATAISAGGSHACALLDDRTVKCWGRGLYGRLGTGDENDRGDAPGEMGDALLAVPLGTDRTAVAISAGGAHTCAVLDDHAVKCWGDNFNGTLGVGDTSNRGDAPGEMGDALPETALGNPAVAVAAGDSSTCALLESERVQCWGWNGVGQLGHGNTANRGETPEGMGAGLPNTGLGEDRLTSAVTAGGLHVCALLDNGQIKCWGLNDEGQLGIGDTANRGDGFGEMGDNLDVVRLIPPNDDFADATALAGPAGTVTAANANAYWELNEPFHAGFDNSDTSVWWSWTAPSTRATRFTTAGSTFDTILAVYTGTSVDALTEVAADDNALGQQSQVDLAVTAGTTYRIAVAGFGPEGSGRIRLNWVQPPANDAFATPVTLTGPSGTRLGTNVGAGREPGEPDHSLNPAINSIWYRWTPTVGGRTIIDTFGSHFDTFLAVYTGNSISGLTPVAANDDILPSEQSEVIFTATAGTTYRIALAAFGYADPASGSTRLFWRQSAPCDGRPVTVDRGMGDQPTAGADVIRGTAANDTINGLGGIDRICGGNGNDTLSGGPGATVDRLFGENGNDTLRGGAGNDALNGGGHNDTLFGEAGNDSLNGGAQRDTCNGGLQRDTQVACEVRTAIP